MHQIPLRWYLQTHCRTGMRTEKKENFRSEQRKNKRRKSDEQKEGERESACVIGYVCHRIDAVYGNRRTGIRQMHIAR